MSEIMGGVTATPIAFDAIKESITDQTYNPESKNAQSGKAVAEALATEVGNIETALDNIIAVQNTLIGGDSV